MSDGTELRRHGDPAVGFGHDRRFTGDWITQHGKAIRGPYGECEKPIEVDQSRLECLFERPLITARSERLKSSSLKGHHSKCHPPFIFLGICSCPSLWQYDSFEAGNHHSFNRHKTY